MAKQRIDVYQKVADKMIAALEDGVAPWRKPWATTAPMSMSTNKPYRGVNMFLLESPHEGEGANWWGTYKRVSELGGQVRKGEKASIAILWKRATRKDADGEESSFMMLRHYNVFSATQADWPDGLPERFRGVSNDNDPIDSAAAIWSNYKGRPSLTHGGNRASYNPGADAIRMPPMESFDSSEAYYSTLFHEAGHSTGHAKRLNRDEVTNLASFGSHSYGREELCAEMTAAMLCAVAGIETEFEASAAYVGAWLRTIRETPKMVVQAAAKAQRAADHVLGTTFDD